MEVFDAIGKNKAAAASIALAGAWLLVRHPVTEWICQGTQTCWLHPNAWPALMGVTASSPVIWVGLLAAVLFALPFGRAGLLTTLVGIHLAQPVFGVAGVALIFITSSVASIVLVHALVEYGLRHPQAAWIHLRLKPVQSVFAPSIRKNSVLWLAVGNLVGSQWHMSALGVLCGISRPRIWLGLLLGNLAGFALLYAFSEVPNLDAVSIVLLVLALALALSAPALWANRKNFARVHQEKKRKTGNSIRSTKARQSRV